MADDLPLKEGLYTWANGKFVEVLDSTVVAIETDEGIVGYGECCPLGSAYLPSYAVGVRAGLLELAPYLIGADPCNVNEINHLMDEALREHPYAKSPIDIACWDISGKSANLPIYSLLGGLAQNEVELFQAVSQQSPYAISDLDVYVEQPCVTYEECASIRVEERQCPLFWTRILMELPKMQWTSSN